LILTSKDGKSFKVDRKNAFISTLVKTGLDTGKEGTSCYVSVFVSITEREKDLPCETGCRCKCHRGSHSGCQVRDS
jgi:hypothetical protein